MIALDTNILIRYLTRDDERQYGQAAALLDKKSSTGDPLFFIATMVMVEMVWVLESAYGWDRVTIAEGLLKLLGVRTMQFEDENGLRLALKAYKRHGDFADQVIARAARAHGAAGIATFDDDFIKHSDLDVRPPDKWK